MTTRLPAGRTFVRRRGTTPIPNATVHDDRLSYAALGLLAVILARPENAPHGYRELMGRGLGQAATLKALRELDEAGYRHQLRRHDERGRVVTDTLVSEEPLTAEEAAEYLNGPHLWKTPSTVRRKVTHGATRANGPSPQVAPRVASPQHGSPEHGEPTHRVLKDSPRETSSPHEDQTRACAHGTPPGYRCRSCPEDAVCPHGAPRRYSACVECRHATEPAPWDDVPTDDVRRRAAGDR